jgi:hypothetical protein
LSNPDKHKTLTLANPVGSVRIDVGSNAETIRIGADLPVNVKGQITREILFADRRPVVETLHKVKRQVADLLEVLRPDFK